AVSLSVLGCTISRASWSDPARSANGPASLHERIVRDVRAEGAEALHLHAVHRHRVDEIVEEDAALHGRHAARPPRAARGAPLLVVDAAEALEARLDADAVDEEAAEGHGVAGAAVAAVFAQRHGNGEELLVDEVVEGQVIRGGLRARAARAELLLVEEL